MIDLKTENLIDLWAKLTFKLNLTNEEIKLLDKISSLLLNEINESK